MFYKKLIKAGPELLKVLFEFVCVDLEALKLDSKLNVIYTIILKTKVNVINNSIKN